MANLNKFIILDRDGVLTIDRKYVHKIKDHKIEDLELLPGVVEGLSKLRDFGCKFIVASNQGGIARKYYTLEDANKFNAGLSKLLAEYGLKIEKFYICPHHPDFTGDCSCRKPKIDLAKKAGEEFGFKPSDAIYIGDKDSDTEFGKNSGAITILIENNQYPTAVKTDYKAKNLSEAADLIKNL